MSEDEKATFPEDMQQVTKGELKEILENMGKVFTEANEKQLAAVEELVSKKINAISIEFTSSIQKNQQDIQAIVDHLNKGNSRSGNITEILNSNVGQELVPIIKEKLGLSGSPDPAVEEFRRNSEMLNKIIYKKAALMTSKMIEKAMKTSIGKDFIAEEASTLAQTAIRHEPV